MPPSGRLRTEVAMGDPGELEALREELEARAVGVWRDTQRGLELIQFAPAPDMPGEVAEGFARGTRLIGLEEASLSVVRAAMTSRVAIAWACELPAHEGSGLWLRRFGADCSIAVPVRDEAGRVRGVISAALIGTTRDEAAIADRLERAGQELLDR